MPKNVAPSPGRNHAQIDESPWWRGASIYQIYPRSFLDTTGNGVGDLQGCKKGLEHIASLGVDAVWLSPFFKSPMKDFGYDVSDFCDVDPLFGNLQDFDELIEEAHNLDLKVVIDQVYSHTSDRHAWFEESREDKTNDKADWYVWADPKPDGSPPNNWQSVFGGAAWTWNSHRRQYFFHNFLSTQPDLNLHNRKVQDALLEVTDFWLKRGVDGFRLDAINFAMHDPELRDNPPAPIPLSKVKRTFDLQDHIFNQSHAAIPKFLERIRAVTDSFEGRFTVAEIGGKDVKGEMKTFTAGNARLNTAYSLDFLYAAKLSKSLIINTMENWSEQDGWPSWAFSNHDAPRVVSRWSGEHEPADFAKFATLLLGALRGNIFLFQGEELGLEQGNVPFDKLQDPEAINNWPQTLGRDGARTPIPWRAAAAFAGFSTSEPWLPLDQRHVPHAIEQQEDEPTSVLHFVRRVMNFRQQSPALRVGKIDFQESPEELIVFTRNSEDEKILCVLNLSDKIATYTADDRDKWRYEIGANIMSADKTSDKLPFELPPISGFYARRI